MCGRGSSSGLLGAAMLPLVFNFPVFCVHVLVRCEPLNRCGCCLWWFHHRTLRETEKLKPPLPNNVARGDHPHRSSLGYLLVCGGGGVETNRCVFVCFLLVAMSVQITEVYLVPSPQTPASVQTKTKSVAIVAPQRSNSLDYLNFEEKRQIIASSLSLSDFLHVGNSTKEIKEIKDGVATVIVGRLQFLCLLLVSKIL